MLRISLVGQFNHKTIQRKKFWKVSFETIEEKGRRVELTVESSAYYLNSLIREVEFKT
jgi:hypothetical protein